MSHEKVRKFEDLIAWQKARALTREIYHVTSTGAFAKDFGLREQIRRASVSIMSNLAEGFERRSIACLVRPRRLPGLSVAYASQSETARAKLIAHNSLLIAHNSSLITP
jgi:four helix bundle protein